VAVAIGIARHLAVGMVLPGENGQAENSRGAWRLAK